MVCLNGVGALIFLLISLLLPQIFLNAFDLMASTVTASAASTAVKKSSLPCRVLCCMKGYVNRCEASSSQKIHKLSPALQEKIAADSAIGADTAALTTKKFFAEQRQLIHYRVVRLIEEARYVFSGQYFKEYSIGKLLEDLRFLTQAFLLFLVMVLIGRRSVYPPIAPDSPFVLALENKPNPNY